ncbi:hypothetical protein VPH35_056196 [Triticum aestivum]
MIMIELGKHLSYLQQEGTRPYSCHAAVSSFDSFVQRGGALTFFTSRATRVMDNDYDSLVGVVLFNHSEVGFTIKPGNSAARMIVDLIVTPDVAEVEDLDAIVQGEGGFGFAGI